MRGSPPPDTGQHSHHLRALESVDVHDVRAREHRDVRGLTRFVAQPFEHGMNELAQLDARRDLLPDVVHLDAEPVALVSRLLDEAVHGERREDAMDSALAEAQAASKLGHTEHRLGIAERREHGHRLVDGRVAAVRPLGHHTAPSIASQQRRVSSAPARYAERAERRFSSVSR